MIRISAGIVTYNPDIGLLKDNIESISNQVDEIFICDNCSNNINEIEDLCKIFVNKIKIIKNNCNKGIAYALNVICKQSYKSGYNWTITLDQDSISPQNLVAELENGIQPNVAIISPKIIYKNNEKYANYSAEGLQELEWCITSASLTNLSVWQQIGGFDEKLFIDGVDKDYCYRARLNGYKILVDNNVCLLHKLGNLKCRRLFNRTIYVTNHSADRKYYMARNAIYLDRKLDLKVSKKYILKLIVKTFLFEDDKINKLIKIRDGIRDGKIMSDVYKDEK